MASSTSLFHHQVSPHHRWGFVVPHTSSVVFSKPVLSFAQISSVVVAPSVSTAGTCDIYKQDWIFQEKKSILPTYPNYTPPHFSGEVLCYTLRCLSVRPSVRAHHFRSITWVFIHGIFSNFAYILLSAMSGMGLLMGKIRPFLTELLPFFVLEKWFLACYSFTVHDIWMKLHRYVAHQRLHIVTKDHHSDLPSLWVIRPW